MTLANKLTLARVVMVPVFVLLLSFPHVATFVLAYAVFTAASITDYYDGKIARERNQVTNFGKLLDSRGGQDTVGGGVHHADDDEILVDTGLDGGGDPGREFLVTGARSLAASEGKVIGANAWGKTKAVVQMVYIFVFLFFATVDLVMEVYFPSATAAFLPAYRGVLQWASLSAIVLVAALTLYSGVQFALINRQLLRWETGHE